MNHLLFAAADFLSRPPGFYVMLAAMLVATIVIPFGVDENLVTYILSVAAVSLKEDVLIKATATPRPFRPSSTSSSWPRTRRAMRWSGWRRQSRRRLPARSPSVSARPRKKPGRHRDDRPG